MRPVTTVYRSCFDPVPMRQPAFQTEILGRVPRRSDILQITNPLTAPGPDTPEPNLSDHLLASSLHQLSP
jgi:hypothetical protein